MAINRSDVSIAIVAKDTASSAISASDYIKGEIKDYSKSGGELDEESEPVFGGFINKEIPASQVEIEFDIRPSLENGDRWEEFIYAEDGTNAGVYTLAGQAAKRAIFFEWSDGTNTKSAAFNNCGAITFDFDHSADDVQTGTFSFKLSPTTPDGVSNVMFTAGAVSTLPDWTALDNN